MAAAGDDMPAGRGGPRPRIAVVGAGVSGLSCAVRLLESGFDVTVFAREQTPATTSDVAAAFWYPYRAGPREKVATWGATTYARLRELAADPATGVVRRAIVHRYAEAAPEPWWKGPVEGFGPLTDEDRFGPWVDGYRYVTWLADTSRYMPWLRGRVEALGGRIVARTIGTLDELRTEHDAAVDAAGVFAGQLAGDAGVFPIRGQVVLVRKPAGFRDEIRESACRYVVPRHDDIVLGGTAQDGDWSREPSESDAAGIIAGCSELCRELDPSDLEILDHRVGLRPGRGEVRVEVEEYGDFPVVHDYGHAGAGFTLSWGCAEDVAARLGARLRVPATDDSPAGAKA
jgi:D-amino-acid oxidase